MVDVKSGKGKETNNKKQQQKHWLENVTSVGPKTPGREIGCQFTPIVFHWPLVRGLVSLMSKRNVIVSLKSLISHDSIILGGSG